MFCKKDCNRKIRIITVSPNVSFLGLIFDTVRNVKSGFKLQSDYRPDGDQPTAIKALVRGLKEGNGTRRFWA